MRFLLFLAFSVSCFAQSHSVTLNWTWTQAGGPAATGFKVYRAPVAGVYTIVATLPINTLTYVDSSTPVQTSGASFYYHITSYNATTESANSNTVQATIPFALTPPAGVTVVVK